MKNEKREVPWHVGDGRSENELTGRQERRGVRRLGEERLGEKGDGDLEEAGQGRSGENLSPSAFPCFMAKSFLLLAKV